MVVVEHKTEEVSRLADRVLVLEEGRRVANGPPEEVFSRRELLHRLGVRGSTGHSQTDWTDLRLRIADCGIRNPKSKIRNPLIPWWN